MIVAISDAQRDLEIFSVFLPGNNHEGGGFQELVSRVVESPAKMVGFALLGDRGEGFPGSLGREMPTLYRTHRRVRTEQIRTVRKITKKAKEASSVVTWGITWCHQAMNRIHVRTAIRAWKVPLNVILDAVFDKYCFLSVRFDAIGPPYGISVLPDIFMRKDFQYLCPSTIL